MIGLRKVLDLTQKSFGERIGMKQNTIALIESGRNTSDQTIFSICREFRVNETWLRTGKGDMFLPDPVTAIDRLIEEYGLCTRERIVIEKFLDLPASTRSAMLDYIESVASALIAAERQSAIDREVESYREELELEASSGGRSSVSGITDAEETG